MIPRPRYAQGDTSTVVGYSVAFHPEARAGEDAAGTGPLWFGGGRLAPDLTLPRLREHWIDGDTQRQAALAEWDRQAARPPAAATRAQGYGPQVWQEAAQALARARARLIAVPIDDVATWAVAAREAAGVLAAWSARLEARPGPLAAAADALARSAQTRHGQPRARRDGPLNLRGVATVVSLAVEGRGVAAQVAVLRQMIRMLDALDEAHRARGQAHQAMASAAASRTQLTRLQHALTAQIAAVPHTGPAPGSITAIPPPTHPPGPPPGPDRGGDLGRG